MSVLNKPPKRFEKVNGRRKLTQDWVIYYFESLGYKLVSEYKNSAEIVDLICPVGHEISMRYSNFVLGHRCRHCRFNSIKINGEDKHINSETKGWRLNPEWVREYFRKEGYSILDEYKSSSSLMRVICPNSHLTNMRYDKFHRGQRCQQCRLINPCHENVTKYLKNFGYELVSFYKNEKQKLDVICPNNHKFTIKIRSFTSGRRCPICSTQNNTLIGKN